MTSKQTKINFGSNRNKPKQDLFRICFGLFREIKKKKISVWFGVSNLQWARKVYAAAAEK